MKKFAETYVKTADNNVKIPITMSEMPKTGKTDESDFKFTKNHDKNAESTVRPSKNNITSKWCVKIWKMHQSF